MAATQHILRETMLPEVVDQLHAVSQKRAYLESRRALKIGNYNMTREEYEQSERAWLEGLLPRGPGDPDAYGYPGEPTNESEEDSEERHNTEKTTETDVPF